MMMTRTSDAVIGTRCRRSMWWSAALLLPLLGGCATVKPWERETLADPIMQPGRYPIVASQLEHVYFSREAASGGTTVGGGGCGCN